MFKAIVFMSIIVSLAYSAPYGGYGGSGGNSFDDGLGIVRDIGISFDSGKGLGVGLEGKGMEMSFGSVPHIGLGEVRHEFVAPVSSVGLGEVRREFVAPMASASLGFGEVHHEIATPLSSSNFMGSSSSAVAVNAPILQRLESEPVVFHDLRPVEVVTQAPFIVHEVKQALSIPRVELPVLKSSGGY